MKRPAQWMIRKRLWDGALCWIAYERVDRSPYPPLWVDRIVANRWTVVMDVVEARVRDAWQWGDHLTPVEPPWSAR